MPATFFITTAIDYTNGAPHLGHAYEKVLADVLARYHRLKGEDVFFLTGVDQHGQKVQQSAEKEGVMPQAYVDRVTGLFHALWAKLGVAYDGWAATTDGSHQQCVRAILQRLWDDQDPATGRSRWLYKDKRGGYYSIRQEQFLTDKERGPDGAFGPEWGQVEFREEENYYFRLEDHRRWLLDLIDERNRREQSLTQPAFRAAELRNAVEKLAGDLCVSRPKSRLAWGIELPFDPDFVTFVWFDALVNYLSFAPGYDPAPGADLTEFHRWWPALHVIGKDILIPAHGVYWPIMLHALGFADHEVPTLLVHGFLNSGGEKMSKTLGNVVDPGELADRYGAEALRYYLARDVTTGRDADFSVEHLISRYNGDLANNVGNLLNRTLSMAQRYLQGVLKKPSDTTCFPLEQGAAGWQMALARYTDDFDAFNVSGALDQPVGCADLCNRFIQEQQPWVMAKDPAQAERLGAVLYHLADSLRIIAILLSPILPTAAHGVFDQLNLHQELAGDSKRFQLADVKWGVLPDGHRINAPVPLFPRIEAKPAS